MIILNLVSKYTPIKYFFKNLITEIKTQYIFFQILNI